MLQQQHASAGCVLMKCRRTHKSIMNSALVCASTQKLNIGLDSMSQHWIQLFFVQTCTLGPSDKVFRLMAWNESWINACKWKDLTMWHTSGQHAQGGNCFLGELACMTRGSMHCCCPESGASKSIKVDAFTELYSKNQKFTSYNQSCNVAGWPVIMLSRKSHAHVLLMWCCTCTHLSVVPRHCSTM